LGVVWSGVFETIVSHYCIHLSKNVINSMSCSVRSKRDHSVVSDGMQQMDHSVVDNGMTCDTAFHKNSWTTCCCVCRSTGMFVFLYALFYYFKRSNMSGALQSIEFFGYTFLACYVFFLMLGTVSFAASLKFIRYIYVNIKMD